MIAKCANPSCKAEFLYLHEGRVFVLNSDAKKRASSSRANFAGQAKGLQYAWLCDGCASNYEVVLDNEGELKLKSHNRYTGLIAGLGVSIGLYAATWAGDLCSFCDLSL